MFSLPHILFIIFTAFFVPIYCRYLKKTDEAHIDNFFKVSSFAAIFFAVIDWVWEYHLTGHINPATSLPLYLCSLFWMVLPIGVFSRSPLVKRIALSNAATTGLLGGILGIVFNVYLSQYPFLNFIPIRSLLYHFIMVLVSSALLITGYYRPKPGDEYISFIPFCMIMIPSLVLNHLYGWDYLYTAGGRGTVLTTFSSAMPRPMFLICLWGLFWFTIKIVFYRKKVFSASVQDANQMT